MTDDASDAARRRVEYLAKEYIRRPYPWGGRRHPLDDGYYELRYALDRLRRADEVIDFVHRTQRDPYTAMADIDETLGDAHGGLVGTRDVLRQNGFLDLLDDHLDTVMRAVDARDLPHDEAAVLEMLGFPRLAATVREQTDILAEEWRNGSAPGLIVVREFRQQSASRSLDAAIDQVERHRTERRPPPQSTSVDVTQEAPKKQRRWWKGLGQIVQGAALAGADVGMAVGVFKFPVSPETQTYGAVMSVTAGVGTMMNGVGDLWGE